MSRSNDALLTAKLKTIMLADPNVAGLRTKVVTENGVVYLMGWTGGYVLLALLLAPFLRKFGKFTVPDFVGDRFYSPTARVVAVIAAIFACIVIFLVALERRLSRIEDRLNKEGDKTT